MNIKLIMIALLPVLAVGLVFAYFNQEREPQMSERITSFEECVEAGFPVMESYPEQCSDGEETFTRDIGNELEKTDLIRVDAPRPGETVVYGETHELTGEARGYWFFEATFPFEVVSEGGDQLFSYYATAEGEWMTEEFVPFNAEFTLEEEYSGPATLILRRSNPSGLSENDDELIIPITISSNAQSGGGETGNQDTVTGNPVDDQGETPVALGGCFIGGCSSQFCSENPDAFSTCEWREEYGCYANATCERQVSGECGWTETAELTQCLSTSRGNETL